LLLVVFAVVPLLLLFLLLVPDDDNNYDYDGVANLFEIFRACAQIYITVITI
jgi:hypothetical protein